MPHNSFHFKLIFFGFLLQILIVFSQDIRVGDSPLFIGENTVLSIDRLVLQPNEEFNLSGVNITKAESSQLPVKFSQLPVFYKFSNSSLPFNGWLGLYYNNVITGDIEPENLTLAVYNGLEWWLGPTTLPDPSIPLLFTLLENKSIQEITLTVRPEPEKEEEFVLDLNQIPNAFSPNNDGKNDRWEILEINRFNEARIKIFNRWGVLVYKANPFFGSWNGESNTNQFFGNGKLPAGVYFYNLLLDQQEFQGYIYKQ